MTLGSSGGAGRTENDDTTVVATNTYTHDNFARLLDTVDLRTGVTSVQSRMANGAVASQVSNGGADTTAYAYDTMGRVTTTTLPDGSTTHTSYTARGQTLAIWGSQTYARLYQYDILGRMSELRTFQDLAYGVQPTVSTVGFAKTTWHYDGQRGWLTEKNYDGETGDGPGGAADYTYTLAGRLKTRTWERGVVTTYGYDQGSLESVVYSNDPTGTAGVTYTYDAFGRSSTVGQGGNLHTYGYDAGSLMLDTETIAYDTDGNGAADFTRVLDMTQDALLRATGHWLKDGAAIENAVVYTYDGAGRLQTVGGAGQSGSAGFAYEYETGAVALLKKVIGPVHTVTNGYEDHRNVLADKENMNAAGTNVISEFTYTTNSIGQCTHLTTSGSAYTSAPVYHWSYNGRGLTCRLFCRGGLLLVGAFLWR